MKTLEWAPLWDAMHVKPFPWVPTTEAMYWQMLECLPPRAMGNGCFLVGEPDHHNAQDEAVYACFKQVGDVFEARYMTLREFNILKGLR